MFRVLVVLPLLFSVPSVPVAQAAECGSTANRAGCVGPNGAVGIGPNGARSYNRTEPRDNQVAPGTHAEGWRGNSATKALEPGCAYVNGRRVCN